jgi:hypothetical protein
MVQRAKYVKKWGKKKMLFTTSFQASSSWLMIKPTVPENFKEGKKLFAYFTR